MRLVEQLGERRQLEELEGRPDIEEQQVRFVEWLVEQGQLEEQLEGPPVGQLEGSLEAKLQEHLGGILPEQFLAPVVSPVESEQPAASTELEREVARAVQSSAIFPGQISAVVPIYYFAVSNFAEQSFVRHLLASIAEGLLLPLALRQLDILAERITR